LRSENVKMVGKLAVVAAGMFAFGYALVPHLQAHLRADGHQHPVAVRAPGARQRRGRADVKLPANTQVDTSRTITVEFDANCARALGVQACAALGAGAPGELTTVMYEFQNVQNRRMAAQAIPSYAPNQAAAHFNKLECFCFNQYTLEPARKKQWAGGLCD
jgi:cytochrome c oxidase assembly protein subunit 11